VIARGVGPDSPFVIVCDHAGRAVPTALGRLGLPAAAFDLHIAYDIGALDLATTLGEKLGAGVIAQAYSRLVIDCNRAPGHAQSVVEVSDGVVIPGNQGLSPHEIEARIAAIHTPYHAYIAQDLKARDARGRSTVLICQHSFTPVMAGEARPWHVGVLHLGNSPISKAMLTLLAREDGLIVGDNEPYAMDGIDYTAPRHGSGPGRDMLELEVRQDLIADPAGQTRVAALLGRLLPFALTMASRDTEPRTRPSA
jgi:predicted N-formylglutamate amidohydrolase